MPRIFYACAKCNCSYSSAESAAKCEASHIDVDHVQSAKFRPVHSDGPYPVSIVVRMANGVDKIYKRA